MVTRNPNHAKNMRGGWPRGALRLTAMLIAAVALLGVSAFADDTTNTQYAQTTYALVEDTGAATKCTQKVDLQRVDAEVGDCMEFFRIVYKDANGTTQAIVGCAPKATYSSADVSKTSGKVADLVAWTEIYEAPSEEVAAAAKTGKEGAAGSGTDGGTK